MAFCADPDILLAKVSIIRKCVATIRRVQTHQPPLEPWVAQDVTVLNLQRAVQASLDVANHLIAANGWELPASARQSFEIARLHGAVAEDLLPAMVGMAGFRNIAVHEYTALDGEMVAKIARERLGDLEAFANAMLKATNDSPHT